jgi:hypothetical protein
MGISCLIGTHHDQLSTDLQVSKSEMEESSRARSESEDQRE